MLIVCTSLDGPAEIHDKARVDVAGRGTYAQVVEKIDHFSKEFGRRVHMLPTITLSILISTSREKIIDEYLAFGARGDTL